MGGFDDHGGIIGDWMPPSPSPRSLFASMLGEDPGSRSVPDSQKHDTGFTFDQQIRSENDDATKSSEFIDQKSSSRAGLVERMAARAGHNAPRLNTEIIKSSDNNSSQNQQTQLPFVSFSPGVSPSSFLESPIFLSNSLAQPSPTTGKFQFGPNGNDNGNGRSSMMFLDSSDRIKDNFFQENNNNNNTSFAFKPFPDSASVPRDHVNPPFMSTQSFQTQETLPQSERQFPPHKIEPNQEPQQHNHNHDDDTSDQRTNGEIGNSNNSSSEDGYNWRKYGQKQVKGSEYPRSYYKCTHLNCPVKKKVERSHEGHITEIIYKGAHNHPKLGPTKRSSGIGSSNMLSDLQGGDGNEQGGGNGGGHWGQDGNYEVTSSGMGVQGQGQGQGQNGHFESSDAVDGSSTFSNDEEDDRVTHGSVSLGYDGEGDESESKRRKVEAYAADVSGATRAIREPRVVVQTTSEVDILDDGYRWRKYGQKVVKGNPNPRSYYKCTSTGCTVRKHVERASHDLKSVITTYEGKHNHDVPAARNSSHANNNSMAAEGGALSMPPEASRMQAAMARFDRAQYAMGPGGPTGTHGYGYPMSQPGGGLAHMGLGNHGKMSVLPVHHYLSQQHQQQQQQQQQHQHSQQLMLPKGEPNVEPITDPGAPIYRQMMNRLPLGPQM